LSHSIGASVSDPFKSRCEFENFLSFVPGDLSL
jgi:hypothetical protein